MESNYKKKYLKYRNKYLNLKNLKIKQLGGQVNKENMSKVDDEFISKIETNLQGKEYEKIKYLDDDCNPMYIVKIKLNDDEKPILFCLAGFSNKSFSNTSNVILPKLDQLRTKFSQIYLFEYNSLKKSQDIACKERKSLETSDLEELSRPEAVLNKKIASNIHEILTNHTVLSEYQKNNIHILGKCNGGWIATLLLLKSPNYKGLYLAVPGIPLGMEIIKEIEKERFNDINFVFGWRSDDGFEFFWKRQSFEEKHEYDNTMEELKIKHQEINYKSYMENIGVPDPTTNHEITPFLIDRIIESI
jgi:hypothetical protein